MTRKEAIQIISEEQLVDYNLNEDRTDRVHEVAIRNCNDKWMVYTTDERAAKVTGSEIIFKNEKYAWDDFIDRLRIHKAIYYDKYPSEGIIELSNIEIHEHCMLNIRTGEKKYDKGKKKIPFFTGLYFKEDNIFFALYPTENGPMMYFEGKEYPLKKDLHIYLKKAGQKREFFIKEYDIHIKYSTSKYIGFDVWSGEKDVDLFYQIEQSYRDEEYYKKFTSEDYHIC